MTDQATPLEFFEAVYLNESLPLNTRLRAATEAAKYRHAQLRAVAISQMEPDSFAAALERCIQRSKQDMPALPTPTVQHPPSELKGNFPMRRRNLR